MKIVRKRISRRCLEQHFILSEPTIASSYAAYILLKQEYRKLDREYIEKCEFPPVETGSL